MRIYLLICFIICALTFTKVNAQNSHWQGFGTWTSNSYTQTLFEDTVDNRLYIGGYASNGFCYYDGNTITPMGSVTCSGGIRKVIRYNDTLYAAAFCSQKPFIKWNGSDWDTTGLATDGSVWSLYVSNGFLYVGGWFTTIAGISANGLAKFDGTTWSAVGNLPLGYNYGIYAITEYNGELYIGGNFGDSAWNTVNILRWNGSQWNTVGGGFHGGMDEVSSLEVFNNVLYIGGSFKVSNGNVGNYIAQWDGTTLSDVGGGVMGINNGNGQIADLMVYNNALYVAGVFSYAGGVFANRIAKWDGTNWCGFGDTIGYGSIIATAEYNGQLYIGGGLWDIEGDSIAGLANWIGGNYVDTCGNTTFISEQESNNRVSVYPNPVSDEITFEFPTSENRLVIIYDYTGREIWRQESDDNAISISVNEFASGLYFYTVVDDHNQTTSGKFVVEH